MELAAWCQAGTGWVVGIAAAGQGDKMAHSVLAFSSAGGMWAHRGVRLGGGTVPLSPWIICPVGSTQGCQGAGVAWGPHG